MTLTLIAVCTEERGRGAGEEDHNTRNIPSRDWRKPQPSSLFTPPSLPSPSASLAVFFFFFITLSKGAIHSVIVCFFSLSLSLFFCCCSDETFFLMLKMLLVFCHGCSANQLSAVEDESFERSKSRREGELWLVFQQQWCPI